MPARHHQARLDPQSGRQRAKPHGPRGRPRHHGVAAMKPASRDERGWRVPRAGTPSCGLIYAGMIAGKPHARSRRPGAAPHQDQACTTSAIQTPRPPGRRPTAPPPIARAARPEVHDHPVLHPRMPAPIARRQRLPCLPHAARHGPTPRRHHSSPTPSAADLPTPNAA